MDIGSWECLYCPHLHSDLQKVQSVKQRPQLMVGEPGVVQCQCDLESVLSVLPARMCRYLKKLISPRLVMFCKEIHTVVYVNSIT